MTTPNKKKLTALFLLLASLPICFAGSLDRSKAPTPGPAPTIQMGDYTSFELPNGLKVFVVENKKLPTLAVSLIQDWDPIREGERAGFVQLAGSMLRRGTKTRSKEDIDNAIDFIGATLFTSSTSISGRCLKKHGETFFEIVADIAQNAQFKVDELEKVRKLAISNLQSAMNDPDQIMNNVRNAVLYGADHPYGEMTTEASLKAVEIGQIQDFYQENFIPNIGYLALIGDITPKEAKAWVEKYFGKWQRRKAAKRGYDLPRQPKAPQVVVVNKPGAVQTVLNLANTIDLKPGSADAIKARVTNVLLGGPNFRLFLNLREDKGYTYGAYAAFDSDQTVGEFRAYAQVRNEVTKDATKEFLLELNRIRDEQVTDEELRLAKNFTSGGFARRLENPATIAQFAINTARYNLAPDYYENYLKEVANITKADIQTTAQKYIKPSSTTIFAVGNAEELETALAEFGAVKRYDAFGNPVDTTAYELPAGLTAQKVLENYVLAVGGTETLGNVKDIQFDGHMGMMGMKLEFKRVMQAPNKSFTSAIMNGQAMFTQVYNGEKGLTSQMGQKSPLEGDKLKALHLESHLIPERFYEKYGIQSTLKGAEKIDGALVYVVVSQLPGNVESVAYFDAETGLKVKAIRTEGNDPATMQSTEFKDYREVEGMRFPFTTVLSAGPQTMEFTTNVIKVNKGISPDQFKLD